MKQSLLIIFLSGVSLLLFTSLTQDQVKLMDTIAGYVYFNVIESEDCVPLDVGTGVQNISVNFTNLDTNEEVADITDESGRFEVMIPERATLRIEPTFNNEILRTAVLNGVTTHDLALIQKHITGNTPLHCPRAKIAADFNYDGKITANDIFQMRQHILKKLADESYTLPIWRFIPNILVNPTIIHPDPTFTNQYWNNLNTSSSDLKYPFNATLNLKGKEYTYNSSDSWINEVASWDHVASSIGCANQNYDFWVVKAGDVNGSAVTYLDPSASRPEEILGEIPEERYVPETPFSSNKNQLSVGNYFLNVQVKSAKKIIAYQMRLTIDPLYAGIVEVNPITDEDSFKQTLEVNYNTDSEEINAGNIITSWNTHLMNGEGIETPLFTTIISLRIKLRNAISSNDELAQAVKLNEELLIPEFISDEGLIARDDIELFLEFVEI